MSLSLDLLGIVCRVPLFVRSFGQKCLSDPINKGLERRSIGSLLEELLSDLDIETLRLRFEESGIVPSFNHVVILCNRCAIPHLSMYNCTYRHIRPYGDFTPHHIVKERDVSPYVVDLSQFIYSGEMVSSDDVSAGIPLTLCNRCDKIFCYHESNYCFLCGLWSKTILTTGFGVCSCKLPKVKSFFKSILFQRVPVPDCTVVVDGFSCHEVSRIFCVTNNSYGDDVTFSVTQSKLLGITYDNQLMPSLQLRPPVRLYFSAYASVVNNVLLDPPTVEKVKVKQTNWRKQRNSINNFKKVPIPDPVPPCSVPDEGCHQECVQMLPLN